MGAFEKITVSVPVETAAALRQSVADGRYLTENEIVRDALNDWVRSREREQAKLAWLRDALSEAAKGPWFTEDEVFSQLEAVIEQQEKS